MDLKEKIDQEKQKTREAGEWIKEEIRLESNTGNRIGCIGLH